MKRICNRCGIRSLARTPGAPRTQDGRPSHERLDQPTARGLPAATARWAASAAARPQATWARATLADANWSDGIFVQPAPGYSPQASKAVLLLTQDRACFLNLILIKDSKFNGTSTLRDVVDDEGKTLRISDFTTGAPETAKPANPHVDFMASMAWSGTINAARGPIKVQGYSTLIHRKDGIVSWVRFMTPADRAAQERPKRDQMLDSIVASQ